MALTRAMLKGMGLTEEQVGAIIDEHTAVTSALKDQISEYKNEAEQLPTIQKELSDLQKTYNDFKKSVDTDDWQGKYNKEHDEFEKYKNDVKSKEELTKVKNAYSKLLTDCNVGSKHINSILKVTDFSNMKLGEDGMLDNADALKESINAEWGGFVTSTKTDGAKVNNPPEGTNPDDATSGRAAELAAKYHDNLYGKNKEE